MVPAAGAAAATLSGTVSGQPASGEPVGLAEVKVRLYESATSKLVTVVGSGPGGKYAAEIPAGVFDVEFAPSSGPWVGTTIPEVEVEGSAELNVTLKEGKGGEEDTEAPQLDELAIEPSSVDTSASDQTVTLLADLTDNLSGLQEATAVFASPSGNQKVIGSFVLATGSPTDGEFEAPVTFPHFSETGPWHITYISLRDKANNFTTVTGEQLEAAELPAQVLVEGEEDTEAPQLDELAIEPSSVDTSASDQTVTLPAHLTDNLSGLQEATVVFASPSGNQKVIGSFVLGTGSPTDGEFEAPVTFPHFSETGPWHITYISLRDKANNFTTVTGEQLEAAELPAQVLVEGEEEPEESEDGEAPQLHGLSIEPTEIDTSAGKQQVFVTAKITDNESGFKSGEVVFLSPNEKQILEGGEVELVSGNEAEGVYRFTVTFPQGSEAGTWSVAKVRLRDNAGNENVIPGAEVEGQNAVVVKSEESGEEEETEDTEAPVLDELGIEPEFIDTSAAKQVVSVFAHVSDDLSGLKEIEVTFDSPSGKSFVAGGASEPIAGTPTSGYYEIPVTFEQFSEAGAWNISSIKLFDHAGHERKLGLGNLKELGFPRTVFVESGEEEAEDTEPPHLVGLEIEPTEVDTSSAKQPVQVTVAISDNLSGFKEGLGRLQIAERRTDRGGAEFKLIAGGPNEGTYAVTTTFEQGAEAGAWNISLIRLIDQAGNKVDIPQAEIEGAELPHTVLVAGGSPQVTLGSSPNPSVHGQKVTLTAAVIPPGEGGPAPLGTIAFVEGTSTLDVVNLKKGAATLNTTALGAGKHPIRAVYSGDANYPAGESPTITQVVEKAGTEVTLSSSLNPAPYGTNASLKASVYAVAPGAGTPAGTVTFRAGETVIDTVQLNGHSASLSLKTLPPGEHAITASYSGDPNNEASKAEAAQAIVKATTELELTSSLNPAPYGSSATLKATVDAVAPSVLNPTGTVTFREGEAVLAIVPLSSGGVAKYPLKSVPPGKYEITATYNGAEGFAGSESGLTQTIVKSATELTSDQHEKPCPEGAGGNLKATVKAISPGGGTPAGTVTFREGETVLATIPLSDSSVTYPLKSLAVGSHEITAAYSGSGNYEGSEDTISQVITP